MFRGTEGKEGKTCCRIGKVGTGKGKKRKGDMEWNVKNGKIKEECTGVL